nr:MAG TPA: DNA directed RNA polymerase [Caudoviricetes sp.]
MEQFKKTLDELYDLYGNKTVVDREIELELESKTIAYNKFMANLNKAKAEGNIMGSTYRLMAEAMAPMVKAVKEFREAANNGKPGKRHSAVTYTQGLTDEELSLITIRAILAASIKNMLGLTLVGISKGIGQKIREELRIKNILAVAPKYTQGAADKRIGESYKKAFYNAVSKKLIDDNLLAPEEKLQDSDLVRIGLKFVELFVESTGLARFVKVSTKKGINYMLHVDGYIMDFLEKNDEELASFMYFKRPMLIKPLDWTTPVDGGYLLKLQKDDSFIKVNKHSLEFYMDVDMPIVYNAVNAIQSTAWRINKEVYYVAEEIVGWTNIPEALGMPTKEAPEKPIRPAEADSNPEVQKKWRKDMMRYYQLDNTRKGKRLLVDMVMEQAKTYLQEDQIYFPHSIDFRGRVYPMTLLSPQGNDFTKGLLEFAEGIELGEDGAKWLAFHGANCWGLDKKPIEERLSWVYENPELISRVADDPLSNLDWTTADSPWEFLGFCFEWAEYLKHGTSFKSHIAVAFDGSCSGLQHYSAMLRDEVGAMAVNLVPDDKVHDIYGIVASKVNEVLKEDAKNGTEDAYVVDPKSKEEYLKKGTQSLATEWLKYGVTRKVTKRSVMTLCYGSKQYGFSEQVYEDTVMPAVLENPLAFSKPKQASSYMAKLIWDSVQKVVVKAVEAMAWLQDASVLLASQTDTMGKALPTYWITPAGFPVKQEYHKTEMKQIKLALGTSVMMHAEDTTGGKIENTKGIFWPAIGRDIPGTIDKRKQRQGIAPNFVHSMDASHLMLTVNACVEKGIHSFAMIHDSYGTHAGNAGVLFKTVREVFVDTYKNHDVLQDIHDHVLNMLSEESARELPDIPEKGNLDLDLVKESAYAFA